MSIEEKENFTFSQDNLEQAKRIIAKYPEGRQRSAVIPLLYIAQNQNNGWLSVPAIEHVAEMLSMPYMRAYEVASFYTMFNLKPVGKYHIQICGTTPCWLRGSDAITNACKKATGANKGETSADGLFTITEVECLGACVNAPMVQINDDYYENLTEESVIEIIEKLKANTTGQQGQKDNKKNKKKK